MRNLQFTNSAWQDYLHWQSQDKKTLKKLNELLLAICREPSSGIGHPEALTGNLSGLWSRRIDHKNRLVYQAADELIIVVSCLNHY
jgi:toxin YoeB